MLVDTITYLERVKMFDFFKGSGKGSVGLDIGSHSIKAVVLESSGDSLELLNFAIRELDPGVIVDGDIVNRDAVISAIKDVINQVGVKSGNKHIYSAVSGRSVIVRRIPMEQMSEEEARQAIQWEAEQHIPFRIDEVSLDFKIINPEIAPGQMEVLLVAAKKDVVDLHRGIIEEAGLTPASVELEQFSLQRAYISAYTEQEDLSECVTILNIGAEVTNMVIVRNGLPSFTRDLSIGGSRFIEALQHSIGVEYEIADEILNGNIPSDVSEEEVHSTISRVIDELSTSIRRSFITYQASGEDTRIDKMFISGGCSLIHGLADILSEQHGLPVEHFAPFRNMTIPEDIIPLDDREALEAVLSVSAGLAIRGYESGLIDINILGLDEAGEKTKSAGKKKKRPTKQVSPIFTVAAIIPFLIAGALAFMNYNSYQDMLREIEIKNAMSESIDLQIIQMGAQIDQQEQMSALESQVIERQLEINTLAMKQKSAVYLLEYFCRALYPVQATPVIEESKNIYLTLMSLSRRNIDISGVARTWGDIIEFQRRLTDVKPDGVNQLFILTDFGQAYMLSGESEFTDMYRFEIQLEINTTALAALINEFAGVAAQIEITETPVNVVEEDPTETQGD